MDNVMPNKKEQETEKIQAGKKSFWRENFEAILIALVLALFIRTFVVQAFKIPSGSMLETLQIGDHILVNKFIYGIHVPFTNVSFLHFYKPERGDIIVFKYPKDEKRDFIKRVVGVSGDTVEVRDKIVYVNGERLRDEDFVAHRDSVMIPGPRDNFGPVTVPQGCYFMMGDNRDGSYDSRFWGYVKEEEILGKALIIYWSWDRENLRPRLGRIGKMIR
ncbi:MAG: signal peptidase I [Nitrospirae bacterium CG2_30_53_67]|nr:MAG: signal peptidase I [Nitrospirae bacterium CG2_30_53_67]